MRSIWEVCPIIVGIDLGTTNSLIACFQDGCPIVIPNVHGEMLTPSVVSIGESGEVYVGKIAKERLVSHPAHTADIFKRSMGTKKQYRLGESSFTPEELSSFIIKKLKEDAQSYLGRDIQEAVISVPAYFNDAQRRATKAAGELAGLKVERIVNEPTAASLAYGFNEEREHAKFLVFDLGGGTFDVSILEKYNNVMEVRAVAGDIFLGGEDFTTILMQMFIEKAGVDIGRMSLIDLAVLRKAAETAKCAFSERQTVQVCAALDGATYEAEIGMRDYEKRCEDLLSRLRLSIKNAISDAAISLSDIDNIILVGGATKLPIVKNFVGKLFGRFPLSSISPDEVVGIGTAVHAALKERNQAITEVVLTDVCPFTLGIESARKLQNGLYYSDLYTPIIERNSTIPISRVERFYTLHDNQKDIHCKILQGESRKASENMLLGELTVPIPKAPAGEEPVDVRFAYDINGILEVEVTVVSSGVKKSIVIEKNPGIFTKEEIGQKLEALSSFKIHPREKEEYRLLLSRGERMYQESLGNLRAVLGRAITDFEVTLDAQDDKRIREHAKKFSELLDKIEKERGYDF